MIQISSNFPIWYPVNIIVGILWTDNNNGYEILYSKTNSSEWGNPNHLYVLSDTTKGAPKSIEMVWLAITEETFYSIEKPLAITNIQDLLMNSLYQYLIIGLAPYGKVSLWAYGETKSILLSWMQGEKIDIDTNEVFPNCENQTLKDICLTFLNEDERVMDNFAQNGLPARDLFDRYMQQFCYRYLVMFERWDEDEERWVKPDLDEEGQPVDGKPLPEFDFIEEALWDGTHDKLHDGGLMSYHQAGKPKKLALEWHIKKSQYSAYLWFEDELIRAAFEKFYGAHRDTKVDFIIRIDPEKNKYELALYRYGLQEPAAISEDAYQMIVFKSKFEYYRSGNYDQPRGAWIW